MRFSNLEVKKTVVIASFISSAAKTLCPVCPVMRDFIVGMVISRG